MFVGAASTGPGSGSSAATAGTTCESIRQYYLTIGTQALTGPYYISTTPSGTARVGCNMDTPVAAVLTYDGLTAATATPSCLHLYTYMGDTSGPRFVNPASPFMAFCDQSDGGGWMLILRYDSTSRASRRSRPRLASSARRPSSIAEASAEVGTSIGGPIVTTRSVPGLGT